MPKFIRLYVVVLQFFFAATAVAQDLVRDAAALERVEIQGVSLSMTPEQAFDALRSAGFQAGNLDAYEDWDTGGIEFVRGTYGSSEGYSSVGMTRKDDRLVIISETYNAPGSPLDANAEINAVKNQLGLPAETTRCRTNGANNGSCQVQDASEPADVNIRYTLQILSTMRMASITRTKELR